MDDSVWDYLSSDLTESILSHLPILSIVRAAAVCKIWRSIVASSAFAARVSAAKQPWFFLCGHHNVFLKNNRAFAFDPEANRWIVLSDSSAALFSEDLFAGSNGFLFAASASAFSFRPILRGAWRHARGLRFSRCSPLVGAFNDDGGGEGIPRFIVVGGVKFVGSLVDIEDRLAVEIYNPCSDSWELCPPLPPEFNTRNSSQSLCSALFNQKFFVLGINSSFISSFNLKTRQWSGVQTLRPQGAQSGFLISSNDRLILAGLCNSGAALSFNLWKIDDEETMEFSEMAIMPPELLRLLIHGDEDDNRAAAGFSLKCVGLGSLIYVFNEEHHRNYPACVCEIKKLESGECYGDWRRLPSLPVRDGNKFHRVISFCSSVSLHNVLD
nr:F-box/kelch-repeat protein At3g24760 [Ipomoea batatas]